MATPDLIKLAPTLSAEERYKLIVPDFHRELMGEKCVMSESERQAIIKFDNRAVWEEYACKVCMLQWANVLWRKDIEMERLRVFGCYLVLNHALERVILDGDDQSIPKDKRAGQFETLKDYVVMLETQSVEFYCYQEAIKKIEQELYSVPLFNEERKKQIAECYASADQSIDHHNEVIRGMCEMEIVKTYIKPIVRDMNSYLVKKPVPDAERVEQMVDEIRQIADAQTQMMGR